MMALAIRLARAVNRALRRSGRVLADRYHLRVLRTPTQVRHALRYVLLNARRHAAKAARGVARATSGTVRLDPASSARWFGGWRPQALARVAWPRTADPPAVSSAHTWLLAVGWRRLGLLDPADVPG
jgi:hypothetical protein